MQKFSNDSDSSDSEEDYQNKEMFMKSKRKKKEKEMKDNMFEKDFQKMCGLNDFQPMGSNPIIETATHRKKQANFLPQQMNSNIEELEKELIKAEKDNNLGLIASLCQSLLEREGLSFDKTKKYLYIRAESLDKLGRSQESLEVLDKLINKIKDSRDEFLVKAYLLCLQINMSTSTTTTTTTTTTTKVSIYSSYLSARLLDYQGNKTQQSVNNQHFQDTSTDTLYSQVTDTLMLYQLRTDQQSSNNQHLLLEHDKITRILPNDQYISHISCSDNHVLAVMNTGILLGWGSNHTGQLIPLYQTAIQQINKPIQIILHPQLVNNQVDKCLAVRDCSFAANTNKQVFAWGSGKEGIEIIGFCEEKVQTMISNGECTLISDKCGQVMIQGCLKDEKGEIRIENKKMRQLDVKSVNGVKEMAIGYNHIVFLAKSGQLYGIGTNHKQQLYLPGQTFSTTVTKLNKVTQLVKHVTCIRDSTFIIDDKGEVSYFGQVTDEKQTGMRQANYQLSNYFEEPKVQQVLGMGEDIYVLLKSDKEMFQWQTKQYNRFKPADFKVKDLFKHVSFGRKYKAFWQSFVYGPFCYAIYEMKTYHTYDEVSLQIHLKDDCDDSYFQNIIENLNILIDLDQDYQQKKEDCDEQQYNYQSSNNHKFIHYFDLNGNLNEVNITQNIENTNLIDIKFIITKEALYKLRLKINDSFINLVSIKEEELEEGKKMEDFIMLNIESGKTQQEKEEEEDQKKMDIYLNQMKENERMLEKQMKAEKALAKMEEEEKEKKIKIKQTQQRAQKNLKSYQVKEKEGKMIDDKERSMRKDLKVGGGFDLKKYDQLKKNK